MDRRRFFELFGGFSVAALPGFRAPERDKIVVAGGGIIGASIAYHLARRGASVTLLEKGKPGGGATANSFAWINSTYDKKPRAYHDLNRLGMEAYRHLDQELGGAFEIQWGGSLEWASEPRAAQELRADVRQHQEWGYAVHLVEAEEFSRLEKDVTPGDVQVAAFAEQEGNVDPVHVVDVYLKNAAALGARIEHPSEITGIDFKWGRLQGVRTALSADGVGVGPHAMNRMTQGRFEADVLVVACGVDTPRVAALAGIDVPLKDSPGLLAHTEPVPRHLSRVVLAPGAHMKQKRDGRIVTGVGFGGGPGTDQSREHGEKMLKEAARFLPALERATLDRVSLGWRPLPKDERPILGTASGAPDVYLAVMHSGVTLSAIVGRLAALEILDGVRVDLLSPYRLSRFQSS